MPGQPRAGERAVAAKLPAHAARAGALRPGLVLIGDKGFAGRDFDKPPRGESAVSPVRPDRRDEVPRHGPAGWIRQRTEPVNDTGKGQLDPEHHGGRTTEGLHARIARRPLAMAARTWHNRATGEPVKRSPTANGHRTHKESFN